MNDAELYQQSNKLQKRDALQCLKEYEKKLRWKSSERVLDIGCGDGGVTTDILRQFIPKDFAALTGCDISEKMVNFANAHHGDHRIQFVVLDIEGDLPADFVRGFDHAYSFYTLHWIHDQDRAFKNIYDLLADDGECLLIFLGHMPLFDVFRSLARWPKWREWLRDVDRFISPYHDSQDPEKDIKRLMAKTGFRNITVKIKEKSFIYNSLQDCKNAVSAVNPFKMSRSVEEEFLQDYMQLVRQMRLIDQVNNNLDETIKTDYTLIVAYGRKEGKKDDDRLSLARDVGLAEEFSTILDLERQAPAPSSQCQWSAATLSEGDLA
ncbi:hypothetical protein O0L34_g11451 [Tuta absoluta]|nr:hypothetical protein O0L34_g11451 [Tuta absoluta]